MDILNIREAGVLLDKVESLEIDLVVIKARDYIKSIEVSNRDDSSIRNVNINQEISLIVKTSIIESIEREIDSLKKEISEL